MLPLIKLKNILLFNKIIIFLIFILILRISFYNFEKIGKNFQGVVTSYKIDGDTLTLIIRNRNTIKATYKFKTLEEKEKFHLNIGDIVKIEGENIPLQKNTNCNLFNYQKYLYSENIFNHIKINKLEVVGYNNLYYFKNIMYKRLINSKYQMMIYFHNNTLFYENILSNFQELGIIRIFSLSGIHLYMIIHFIKKYFKKEIFSITVFLLFLLFFGINIALFKLMVIYILNKIFKKEKIFTLIMAFLIFLIINPYFIYNMGFIYSFLISFLILLNPYSSKYLFFYINILLIPINIYYGVGISILNLVISFLLYPLFKYLIFPFSLFAIILNINIDNYLSFLENIIIFINQYNYIYYLIKPSIFILVLYYILIYIFLKYKIILIYFLIIVHLLYPYLDNTIYIHTIDVGVGDSHLIETSDNKIILIDTGGGSFKKSWQKKANPYKVGEDVIIPYLHNLGINKIDALIITHGDLDHIGGAKDILKKISVDKIYLNSYENTKLETELEKYKPIHIAKVNIKLGINNLRFLNEANSNENEDSLVLYINLGGYNFLFMGDAGHVVEEKLPNLKVDVLKVGHHGSKNSTSKNFIDKINPKYSIISTGLKNRYGHPHKEVLDILKDTKIYRTDIDGGIIFKISNNNLIIKTCS